MPVLGTKLYWIPSPGSDTTQQASQILKNSGYFSLQLLTVNYLPKGNFWQNTFGGTDTITLTSNLKYQSDTASVEACSVQDLRKVKVGNPVNLGLMQRNIAVKIPATVDALTFNVTMTAVKTDTLQAKFDMLNDPGFQSAFELMPLVAGQVFTVTKLVKKLLTESTGQGQLEAGFGAIIAEQASANPVNQGRLTAGYLIVLDTNNGADFTNADDSKFELRGNSLYYDGTIISNTYVVVNISFDKLKGENQHARWYKKYMEGMSKLDDMQQTADLDEIKKIFENARKSWIEGNALLDEDATYLNGERLKIKAAALKDLKDKYDESMENYRSAPDASALVADIMQLFKQKADAQDAVPALPTLSHLFSFTPGDEVAPAIKEPDLQYVSLSKLTNALDSDVAAYKQALAEENLHFTLKAQP